MDFIEGFTMTPMRKIFIMVIVDRLTKISHFVPNANTFAAPNVAQIFLWEVIHSHGVTQNIISNIDAQFIGMFWENLQASMGTQLNFITSYHPEKNGQTERVNQV